jgi:hypothetical protein
METNPIYASSGYPKNVDNLKQIRLSICKELHISNHISFKRETPNRVTWSTNMHDTEKRGVLCLTSLSRKVTSRGRCTQEKPQLLQAPPIQACRPRTWTAAGLSPSCPCNNSITRSIISFIDTKNISKRNTCSYCSMWFLICAAWKAMRTSKLK